MNIIYVYMQGLKMLDIYQVGNKHRSRYISRLRFYLGSENTSKYWKLILHFLDNIIANNFHGVSLADMVTGCFCTERKIVTVSIFTY